MINEIVSGIFTFQIPLPKNPLSWLNCYVLKGTDNDRNLLIDLGFNKPECLDALLSGMEELGLTPENTDILITHMHTDHSGNGAELFSRGFKILMNPVDHRFLFHTKGEFAPRAHIMGIPESVQNAILESNKGMITGSEYFEISPVSDGQIIEYGGRKLECIEVPGHTPGNLCLYDAENRIMFTGDHVLFTISPNIVSWTGYDNTLGDYMNSLLRIREYPVSMALPAHRKIINSKSVKERADDLLFHHFERLNEILWVLQRKPGQSAYEVSSKILWNIHAKNWEEFPAGQKWFAVGETMAHLQCLLHRGELLMIPDKDGVSRYYPV